MNTYKLIPSLLIASFIFSSASAQTTIDDALDRRIDDTSENNTGDALRGSGDQRLVGDSGDNDRVFATAWTFDISSFTTEIDAASTIMFSVELNSFGGAPQSVFPILDFFSLETPSSLTADDYENSTNLLGTIDMTGFTAGDTVEFDVTSIVKAATDDVGFIMKVQNPLGANNENGNGDVYIFTGSSGQLSVIPEPSSFALLAGCLGLASVMLRRRG
ncbi:PEP-CTERM sorting domain-containing protein [Coraliomargarita sp. SDUM461003]|uniref:PEP-CTERM sorting domain-containing protein n=1 Tax=Thalassobacterium maritimum TaxID=3041265 RepID=A0ABU1AUK4_9BACT|nr:PEP-CTERM sorting domain-containing protein [Coraliomargarita sp. SDUM461003]MDQ8207317.1 PEP-CTERM sorting domain-containing protein [Coraliomargarita sp. SDUM461003]